MRRIQISSVPALCTMLVAASLITSVHAEMGVPRPGLPVERAGDYGPGLAQLHAAATSDHTVTRIDAVQKIAAAADPDSLRVLERALSDAEPAVRESAAVGLARIGDPSSVPALVGAIHDESRAVRAQAAIAIAGIEPSAATISGFLAGFDSRSAKASGSRGRQASPRAAAGQVDESPLSGSSPLVISKKVLRGMVTSRPAVSGSLKNALSGADDLTRYMAAYALGASQEPDIIAAFERALRRKDTAVVSGAYEFFLHSGADPERMAAAIPVLLAGLQAFDDADLILALSRCGEDELEAAASRVARLKGVRIGN